ncbi:unnamed protein product [Periconia digitata]|uniref:C2H2-type domain-containing protein n=1 Tax=Periconia digitata TaxID=1303443 RepID=A0A9W4XP85_9PLEO|nr:unnamed protein product [Periconia digitata]
MLSSPPTLVGTKRSADGETATKDCQACENAGCFNTLHDARPSKRIASVVDVGAFHTAVDEADLGGLESGDHFPDICFEKFCQDCNWETSCDSPCDSPCNSPCVVPCSEPECEQEACWDPHCDNQCDEVQCDQQYCVHKGHCDQQPCNDQCVDPECTKLSGTNDPCFCHSCEVQSCPLGKPNDECHMAEPGLSTPSKDALHCFDSATCRLQDQGSELRQGMLPYESYPCYLTSHNAWDNSHSITHTSYADTPSLSCHTPLDSVFSEHLSPASKQAPNTGSCFLNIPAEHCHIDNSCCHGEARACGEDPTAPSEYLSLLQKSMAPGNALADSFTDFGLAYDFSLGSQPFSPESMGSIVMDKSFHNTNPNLEATWLYPQPQYTNLIPSLAEDSGTKLDLLASAIQNDVLQPESSLTIPDSMCTGVATTGTDNGHGSVCRWQHRPGVLCLAVFDSAESLHKHIKSVHVDSCNQCFCQWENCESSTKDFKQRSKLSRHLLGHAGHRPYACSFDGCDKMFATNQAKANHERTHTGDRPYECKQCGYTTTTYTQLQTHISALHEGKKPHKCRFCDFSCADSSNLSKHERTHQTLRPYRCLHPGCTFKPDCRWENLKRHLRRAGHCPELLIEGGEAHKTYREAVRREIDEFNKREGAGAAGKGSRRRK